MLSSAEQMECMKQIKRMKPSSSTKKTRTTRTRAPREISYEGMYNVLAWSHEQHGYPYE